MNNKRKIILYIIIGLIISVSFLWVSNIYWINHNLLRNQSCVKNIERIEVIGKNYIMQIQSYKLQNDTNIHDYNKILENFYFRYNNSIGSDTQTYRNTDSLINFVQEDFLINYCYKRRWPMLRFGESRLVYGPVIDCERFVERSLYLGKYCIIKTLEYIFVLEKGEEKYLVNLCFLLTEKKVFGIRNTLRNRLE